MREKELVRTAPDGRLVCPRCGTETNRQAEKLDYSADSSHPAFDAVLGAALAEFHTCPGCTYVIERAVAR